MGCVYAAYTVRVTIFNTGSKFQPFYGVTRSYSSHPFLCALDRSYILVSYRPKLSTNVAYKHVSVVPRDADVQNHRIFVGKYESLRDPTVGRI